MRHARVVPRSNTTEKPGCGAKGSSQSEQEPLRLRLLVLYSAAIVGGNLAQGILSPKQIAVGASGGIVGLMTALLALALFRSDRMPNGLHGGRLVSVRSGTIIDVDFLCHTDISEDWAKAADRVFSSIEWSQ